MSDKLEYLAWCETRQVFLDTMGALTNPIDGKPLIYWDEGTESYVGSTGVRFDEIGHVIKGGAYDPEGNEIEAPTVVDGHHVNLLAVGELATLLNDLGGWQAILGLLDDMQPTSRSKKGVPEGWKGKSGLRIYPRDHVTQPARIWAFPQEEPENDQRTDQADPKGAPGGRVRPKGH